MSKYVPSAIVDVMRSEFDFDYDVTIYLVELIDGMRFCKGFSREVHQKFIETMFGGHIRKDVIRFLKRCTELGLMTHNPRFRPYRPGITGMSKSWGLPLDLLDYVPLHLGPERAGSDVSGPVTRVPHYTGPPIPSPPAALPGASSSCLPAAPSCSPAAGVGGDGGSSDDGGSGPRRVRLFRRSGSCRTEVGATLRAAEAFDIPDADMDGLRDRAIEAFKKLGWDCSRIDFEMGGSTDAVDCASSDLEISDEFTAKLDELNRIRIENEKTVGAGRKSRRRKALLVTGGAEDGYGSVVEKGEYECAAPGSQSRKLNADEIVKCLGRMRRGEWGAWRQNGRCYHAASSLPKWVRKKCVFRRKDGSQQRGVDVDVHAMHMSIAVCNMYEGAEKDGLIRAAERGCLYEYICHGILTRGGGGGLRGRERGEGFKRVANAFLLYGDWGSEASAQRNELTDAFKAAFPVLYRVIANWQYRWSARQISQRLTRIEGQITLDRVCKWMWEDGLTCLPFHDACWVAEGDAEACQRHYERALREVLGFVPMVRVKE